MNYPAASGRGINKENIFNIAASGRIEHRLRGPVQSVQGDLRQAVEPYIDDG
jgi:hypothetical protein